MRQFNAPILLITTNSFVTTCRVWTASGGVHALLVLEPTLVIVVMRRMGALNCLHDSTIYVLCTLLCVC